MDRDDDKAIWNFELWAPDGTRRSVRMQGPDCNIQIVDGNEYSLSAEERSGLWRASRGKDLTTGAKLFCGTSARSWGATAVFLAIFLAVAAIIVVTAITQF